MFDTTDLKGPSTGLVIWKRYTPNKDKGATFLNHLAQQCGTPSQIDTARLAAVPGAHAVVYSKIATFLSSVMGNFKANSYFASTTFHNNDQEMYPVDSGRPERYVELGISKTGQTRIVFDRVTKTCYLSTHYEAPKALLIGGAAPNAAIAYIEQEIQVRGYDAI